MGSVSKKKKGGNCQRKSMSNRDPPDIHLGGFGKLNW